jgi:phosphotransferase family enzyme
MDLPEQREQELPGGNFDSQVIRIGSTVRRRAGPWTPAVHALLTHLAACGFSSAPLGHGLDDRGREVLRYVEGQAGRYPLPAYMRSDATLVSVGRLLRSFHDLTLGFAPPPSAVWQQGPADPGPVEVVCHNDWAPYNAIFSQRQLRAFIDWEFARPGSRLWDLAWTAHTWVPLWDDGDIVSHGWTTPPDRAARLRYLCDAYGLRDRARLVSTIQERVLGTAAWLQYGADHGNAVFRRLVDEGHLGGYQRASRFLEGCKKELEAAL